MVRFFAAALMAAGGLIAGLCGTCTAGFVAFSLFDALRYPGGAGALLPALMMFAIVGGVPTLIGVLVFRAGWRRFRPQPGPSRAEVAAFSDEEDRP